MNSLQMKFFLEAAKQQNFTKAAKALYVTQSNISKQIAMLEQELDVKLFYRDNNSVHLTPAGTIVYQDFITIDKLLETTKIRAKAAEKGEEGTLNIGIISSLLLSDYLSEILETFSQRFPNIHVNVEKDSMRPTYEKLQRGYYDCIISTKCSMENFLNLSYYHIMSKPYCIVLHQNHPLFDQEDVSMGDLADYEFATFVDEQFIGGHNNCIRLCQHYGFIPKIGKVVSTLESYFMHTELGAEVSLMPRECPAFGSPKLRFIDIQDEYDEKYLNIGIVHAKPQKNPCISLLIQVIDEMNETMKE